MKKSSQRSRQRTEDLDLGQQKRQRPHVHVLAVNLIVDWRQFANALMEPDEYRYVGQGLQIQSTWT
jgi:hypothetical protein